MSRFRKLRLERLESKNLLAGDVTAQLIDGDLIITGDLSDNQIRIAPDSSLTNPGIGEVTVTGLGTGPSATTVGGGVSLSFSGADAVTGDIILNFTAGGNNDVFFEKLSTSIDRLELPGGIEMVGGAGFDDLFVVDTIVEGNVSFTDTTTTSGDSFAGLERSVVGGNFTMTTAGGAVSDFAVDDGSVVEGNATLLATSSNVGLSFFGVRNSTVEGDARHFSDAATSETQLFGAEVEDDVILDLTEGDDVVTVAVGMSTNQTEIDDDLRIFTNGGSDRVELFDFTVHDDVVFRGGSGDDVFLIELDQLESNTIGDDLYITGGAGAENIGVEDVNIGDKLRISGGRGDDVVAINDVNVLGSALISLGSGMNQTTLDALYTGQSLTVVGRGSNDISLDDVHASTFLTIVTTSGVDIITMREVTTPSALISTQAGSDDVAITESAFDYLFVLLGSGDDILTLEGVSVSRFSFLSGGSGADDTLVDVADNDIDFAIDFEL